ncbi:MAG: FAD-dependent oxidoreductase [Chitinophagaceae bacterium]
MDLKSNEPFWLIKNGLLASYPSLQKNVDCDVLVVGGGITGSLIAHQCIQDGYKTILIDKREIAHGSSSATTSMLQYELDKPLYELAKMIGEKGATATYKACYRAIDQIGSIARKIKSQAGFRKKMSLYFADRKKAVEALRLELQARQTAGFEVQWLEAQQIRDTYDLQKTWGGILSRQGASIDAFRFVHELLAYNYRKGLQIYDKTELIEVTHSHRASKVRVHTGAMIRCKKIIYCTGYESAHMIREKFVDLISTYAIVSEVMPGLSRQYNDLLIWNTADPYVYIRSTDDGRMLIGGADEPFRDPVRRDALITKKEQRLTRSFEKYFPAHSFFSDFAWAGTFGSTSDSLPYIGEHRNFKNAYFVLGFGGNGITFSVTGMEMVSLWLRGKKHLLSPFFGFGR